MKLNLLTLGASLIAAACIAGSAQAQTSGAEVKPYVMIGAGYANATDDHYDLFGGGEVDSGGYGIPASASVGLKDLLGPVGLRLDYYSSGIDFLQAFTDTVSVEAVFLNAMVEIPLRDSNRQHVYFGAGIGQMDGEYGQDCSGCGVLRADRTEGAQGIAGIRIGQGPVSFFLEERYIYSKDMQLSDTLNANYRSWATMLGVHIELY